MSSHIEMTALEKDQFYSLERKKKYSENDSAITLGDESNDNNECITQPNFSHLTHVPYMVWGSFSLFFLNPIIFLWLAQKHVTGFIIYSWWKLALSGLIMLVGNEFVLKVVVSACISFIIKHLKSNGSVLICNLLGLIGYPGCTALLLYIIPMIHFNGVSSIVFGNIIMNIPLMLSWVVCEFFILNVKKEITLPNGSIYNGQLKLPQAHGEGILTYVDGRKYEGNFVEGIKTGRGKLSEPDGSTYEGMWAANKKDGHGLYDYSDNSHYEGTFSKDKRSGKGMMVWPDGSWYKGTWKNDKMDGEGVYVHDGVTDKGIWVNGVKMQNES